VQVVEQRDQLGDVVAVAAVSAASVMPEAPAQEQRAVRSRGVRAHFPRRSLPSSVLLPPAFSGEGCCCHAKSNARRFAYTDAGVAEQKRPGLCA
jgi:hypothetical protein